MPYELADDVAADLSQSVDFWKRVAVPQIKSCIASDTTYIYPIEYEVMPTTFNGLKYGEYRRFITAETAEKIKSC